MNKIYSAAQEDKQEILSLYRTMLNGPAEWNEYYPNEDTIEFDLSRNALFVMKNDEGQIIAAISRLCVRKDMQHQGIAKEMIRYVFEILKKQGKKGVHILVKTGHKAALSLYGSLGFHSVGECSLFGKDFVCMEIAL